MAKPTEAPTGKEFTITLGTVKWIAGFIAGVIGVVLAYWALSDKIASSLDARWRLEQVQLAKDKEYAAEIKRVDNDVKAAKEKAEVDNKAARDKAEADTKLLAKKAETGRAWLQWTVVDTRADISTKLVVICKGLRLSQNECDRWSEDARRATTEAERKKIVAEEFSSKDK